MRILYICTHNRCRSILSEAITNHFGQKLVVASSAGSQPVGKVHPLTLKYLDEYGMPTAGLKSESWNDLEDFKPDLVVTVCDTAAKESCPIWFGDCTVVHWGLEDPSKIEGTDKEKRAAFVHCIERIKTRVQALVAFAQSSKTVSSEALQELMHSVD